ncbi:MAG: DUF481 domain-containing protein [Gemmatimonadetes bacterium]|nr:DUF481 domain-containing protein [Gemmatimonadota bacterium]NNF12117.1 DUF481 domain-containing protein [Gemmatimonadota bacterium]NNL29598.1 DUF481 domain-containing protein [Gemmatimonadota bacterium]
MISRTACIAPLVLAGTLFAAHPAVAQDTGWSWENSTEVGFVTTSGNASQTTLSLKSSLTGTSGANTFKIGVGGLRASSDITTRTAQGTPGSFTVTETTNEVTSASNYYARARYDRELGEAFLFTGAGWERNTFAGYQNRYSTVAGVGRTWVDSDDGRFKTDVGGTYTVQEDVQTPGEREGFFGFRVTIEGARSLTETTDFETEFVLDENLETSDDLRFDWLSSIAVALTEGLALKTSYQLVFDNDPALLSVPLFTGGTENGTVGVPSSQFDSLLTLSLVIKL